MKFFILTIDFFFYPNLKCDLSRNKIEAGYNAYFVLYYISSNLQHLSSRYHYRLRFLSLGLGLISSSVTLRQRLII